MTPMGSLEVEKVIHINQVLGAFEEANDFYADVFGAQEYMNSYDPGERRDASLFVIGDTCIELFSPRDDESLLGTNLARYGDSWHSFELKVPDLDAAKEVMDEHGVRVTTYRPGSFFMVHPKDTHGLLLEVCSHDMSNDPRVETGWTAEPWRDHPMGIRQLNNLSCAVRDLGDASELLSVLIGADPVDREHRPAVGPYVCFWLGDTMLELIEPESAESPVASYIEKYGPRMRSLLWQVDDVEAARRHLEGKGLGVVDGDVEGWIAIDPGDNYGVLWQFTEDPQTGDPR
jgi:catechol 2,3-dioxygenase-like lactoylglutathione lyase family enzyme